MFPVMDHNSEPIEMQQGDGMNRLSLGGSANFSVGVRMDRPSCFGLDTPCNGLPRDAEVSELLGRRTSLGSAYDCASTASDPDEYILDLTRRRRDSACMGGAPSPPSGFPSVINMELPSLKEQRNMNRGMKTALEARQQELQMQQAELENRQRELMLQRQQLLASLQESSIYRHPSGITSEQPFPRMVSPADSYLEDQLMNGDILPLPHEEEVMAALESDQDSSSTQLHCVRSAS